MDHRLDVVGVASDGEENGVELQGIIQFEIGDAHRHHDVGGRVAAREEVFDFLAGFDVPIRHPMRLHDRDIDIRFLKEGVVAMADVFHDAESHLGFDSLQNEIGHDIVAAPDDAVDVGDTIEDQVFGVALPNVGAVAQA